MGKQQVSELREKINESLILPRSKENQAGRIQFWHGYVTGLMDSDIINAGEAQDLHHFIYEVGE